MGNIARRLERLEDRFMLKEIKGFYLAKIVSEEWKVEYRKMLEEHYRKYGWIAK